MIGLALAVPVDGQIRGRLIGLAVAVPVDVVGDWLGLAVAVPVDGKYVALIILRYVGGIPLAGVLPMVDAA